MLFIWSALNTAEEHQPQGQEVGWDFVSDGSSNLLAESAFIAGAICIVFGVGSVVVGLAKRNRESRL
jgi:hypothetical protein